MRNEGVLFFRLSCVKMFLILYDSISRLFASVIIYKPFLCIAWPNQNFELNPV
jgi:hypothetical protein